MSEQNAKQIFLFRQVCKVPKEGHYCAKIRALLCPREAQKCTSQIPPVNPKHRFLSFRDTSRKQVIWTLLIMRNINADPFTKSGSESNSPSIYICDAYDL